MILYGTDTIAPAQNGEPDMVPVVTVWFLPANTKNLLVPMTLEAETPFVPAVPAKEVYGPVNERLPPIASKGAIAVGRVNETELLVKLPEVVNVQYSVLLMETKVASNVPPGFAVNADTWAVAVPEVVGLTSAKGR